MKTPPHCSAPDAEVSAPDFELPENACDCHFHIFDEPSKQVLPRTYTAPPVPLEQLIRVHNILGISRSVVVQPSIYGTDNRTTLSALESTHTQANSMKAIVVIEDSTSFATLTKLKNAGAVGCRVNLLFQSNAQIANLKSLALKAAELDWHVQLLIDVSTFDNLETTIKSLDVPVVFDHMGHMPSHKGVNDPGFQQLLRLLGNGKAWVKLSGPYRVSDGSHPNYADVDSIVDALVRTNPDQLIWGSDWPHPHVSGAMPNDTDLLNLLPKWVPDARTRNRILAQNPAQLYGF